jgi:hypothetical protein
MDSVSSTRSGWNDAKKDLLFSDGVHPRASAVPFSGCFFSAFAFASASAWTYNRAIMG